MRKCLALIPLLLLLLSTAPLSGASSSSPAYVIPAFPVMMYLRPVSNGSTAFIFIQTEVYGNYVSYMCPIDYPDTDFECHDVSETSYLLVELGNGTALMNLGSLINGTGEPERSFSLYPSLAPFGHSWFLVYGHTAREYYPHQNSFGASRNVSTVTAWTLSNLWLVMSVTPEISNGSLIFSFPYNGTYSVPLDLFRPYLKPLAFNVSEGLSEREFLEHLRAVPFRGGLLIYLPTYGISLCGNGSIVLENPLNPYIPYWWVYYRESEFPKHSFPLVFYYRNGRLKPALKLVPHGNSLTFNISKMIPFKVIGDSSVPKVNAPNNALYVGEIRVDTGYPPTNVTFVRISFVSPGSERKHLLAEIVNGRFLIYLKMPFEGRFYYSRDHWFYECASCHPKRYYLYNWRNHTLIEGNFSPDSEIVENVSPSLWNATAVSLAFNDRTIDLYLAPLSNFSECLPPSRPVAMKLKEMGIARGVFLYFPHYTTGVSLVGREWAIVSGTGADIGVGVSEALPCPAFYYAGGRIRFRMKLGVAHATVPVGNWRLTLSYPYINATPMVNVTVVQLGIENTTSTPSSNTTTSANPTSPTTSSTPSPTSGWGICGPGAVLLLVVLVLILWKSGLR